MDLRDSYEISIHALLAESDTCLDNKTTQRAISIHALLAESDTQTKQTEVHTMKFLSTLSLRRATASSTVIVILIKNFYPRSPCGERLEPSTTRRLTNIFLSTLSLRRATGLGVGLYLVTEISIHALLAESDSAKSTPEDAKRYFYPRSPCGERRKSNKLAEYRLVFLSTLSLRRATHHQP